MMPEAWAFQRGQARLVVPTWGTMAPVLACVAIVCTPIEREIEKFIITLLLLCFILLLVVDLS